MKEALQEVFKKFVAQEFGNKITEFNISGLANAVFMTLSTPKKEEEIVSSAPLVRPADTDGNGM